MSQGSSRIRGELLWSRRLFDRSQSFASNNLQISGEVAISDPSRHVHSNGVLYGRHSIICACVNAYSLYTVLSLMPVASDCNKKFHSEVHLNQERERTRQRKREDVEKR